MLKGGQCIVNTGYKNEKSGIPLLAAWSKVRLKNDLDESDCQTSFFFTNNINMKKE